MPLQLETERLKLRLFTIENFDELCVLQADPKVMQFMGEGGKLRSPKTSFSNLAFYLGQWVLLGYGFYAVFDAQDRFIGRAGVNHPHHWPAPEIAFAFRADQWGKGFASEVVATLVPLALKSLKPERLISVIHSQNLASQKVVQKNGARLTEETEMEGSPVGIWDYPLS